jgi:TolB-like protein/DNA-binding winged helix-turn-helix (wHTH) protein/Tfp pilus assembly protein PilF
MANIISSVPVVRFGVFEFEVAAGELRKRGVRLSIQGLPLHILAILVSSPGAVVTREELRNRLWPADTFVDFDHSIRNAVARLREALDDSAGTPRYIETLPRRGYRFIGVIETSSRSENGVSARVPAVALPGSTSRRLSKTVVFLLTLGIIVGLGVLTALPLLRRNSPSPIRSLAVLPLKNLSGDPSQEYLADGMTEDLIGQLTKIRDLRVISRTSAMRFKDTQLTVPEIARTLRVDAVVEGSVIREGRRIRVHAQLIRAATDEHFWSEAYDRDMGDTLALQSELAQRIAAKVQVTITGEERARLANVRHIAPEVYESFLKGRFVRGKDRHAVEESVAHFQEAIAKDPTFAPAYLELGGAYYQLGTIFLGEPPQEMRPKAMAAVRKALELEPDMAEGHAFLGSLYQEEFRWKEAEVEYQRALTIEPNDPVATGHYGFWLLCQGSPEDALEWVRRARDLDPIAVDGNNLGWILFQARHYDEAIRELRSVLALDPNDATAYWFMGFVLIAKGQPNEAIPLLEKTVTLMDRSPGSIEILATAYASAGRRADALRLINELKRRGRQGYVPAGAFINPYLALRDDEAFVWFERAYQEKSAILQFLKVHPYFDPVRKDPRFVDLTRRVGLN